MVWFLPTVWFASGSEDSMVFGGLVMSMSVVMLNWPVQPYWDWSLLCAAETVSPTRLGIVNWSPSDTVSVTVLPGVALVPPVGLWLSTWSFVWALDLVCFTTLKPAFSR